MIKTFEKQIKWKKVVKNKKYLRQKMMECSKNIFKEVLIL